MKIVTLNCFLSPWCPGRKKRLPYLTEAILAEEPDIVLVQEVFFESSAQYLIKKFRNCGYIDHFYSRTLLMISKYPFISRVHKNFKCHFGPNILFDTIEILNWLYGKGYQVTEINLGDKPIIIVNTHFLSAYGLDYDSFSKTRLRQLSEIINHLKHANVRWVILGGDFNFDTNSSSYQTITNHYGFYDPLHELRGNTISTDNLNRQFFLLAKMDQRIDHFFIKGFEQIKTSGQIIFREPYLVDGKKLHISDHYGLSLDVQ